MAVSEIDRIRNSRERNDYQPTMQLTGAAARRVGGSETPAVGESATVQTSQTRGQGPKLPDNGRRLPKNPKEGQTYEGYVMMAGPNRKEKGEYRWTADNFRVGDPPEGATHYYGGWYGRKPATTDTYAVDATWRNGKWNFVWLD